MAYLIDLNTGLKEEFTRVLYNVTEAKSKVLESILKGFCNIINKEP